MLVSGKLRVAAPKGRVIGAMHQAENLAAFLPGHASVTKTGVGGYDFVVSKALGPITIRMSGTMQVLPITRGLTYSMVAESTHLVAGSVVLTVQMNFSGAGDETEMDYAGELKATGMAGAILEKQRARVQIQLDYGMAAIKQRVEHSFARQLQMTTDPDSAVM